MDNKETFDRKILDRYFSNKARQEDLETLYCYINNKPLYNKLQEIYNHYSQYPKINPFVEYMREKNLYIADQNDKGDSNKKKENINFKWLEIDNYKLKYLKYIKNKKSIDNVIELTSHSNKSNTKSHAILESLKWLSMRLYSNSKGNVELVRINAKVLKFNKAKQNLVIDETKLDKLLDELKIDDKSKFIEINRGTIFCDGNEKYYWCCGGTGNKIEIKPIDHLNKDKNGEAKRSPQITISTIVKNYQIVEMDEIGNIYKRIAIKEYFDNK